jgi:hypothetical protein
VRLRPSYSVGFSGAAGTVSWIISNGMKMPKYTSTIIEVTAMGMNEVGL